MSIELAIANFQAAQEAATQIIKNEFGKTVGGILSDHGLKSVSWTQFTQYFNDGDTCEFGVHFNDYYVTYVTADGTTIRWSDVCYSKTIDPTHSSCLKAIQKFIRSIPNDILLAAFGDHKLIICYADGRLEVQKYENHD